MNKRIFFIIFTLFFSLNATDPSQSDQASDTDKIIYVFLFDWHDVVVKKKPLKAAWCGAKILGAHVDDLSNLGSSGLGILTEAMTGEKLSIEYILEKFPSLQPYEGHMYECQEALEEPDQDVINLILRLKAQGIKVVLASNMHEGLYQSYQKSRKAELLALFDLHHIATEENGEKPGAKYYITGRARINKEFCDDRKECTDTMKLFFTDDRPENIDGAHKAQVGIDAILFKNGKQLTSEILRREILKEEKK